MLKIVQFQGLCPGPHWGHAPTSPYRLTLPRSPRSLALLACYAALAKPWLEKLSCAATASPPFWSLRQLNNEIPNFERYYASYSKYHYCRFTTMDKHDLLDATCCLNDRVINAAQGLLREKYVNVNGLFDTVAVAASTLELRLPCGNNDNVIQIVHDNVMQHWLCVTSKNCSDGNLAIYCSMQLVPSGQCLATVANMFNVQTSSLTFRVMNVSKQKGSVDCGLFAIAYAEMLATDVDPCNFILSQPLMREHLMRCLSENQLRAFPVAGQQTIRRSVVRSTSVKLYCQCRSTHLPGDEMLLCNQCHEWYHKRCLRITDEAFARFAGTTIPYVCPRCAVPKAGDAAEVFNTAIDSPSSASTLTAMGDEVNCAEIFTDEEEELKSVC